MTNTVERARIPQDVEGKEDSHPPVATDKKQTLKQPKNFKRNQRDYYVMIGICFVCYHIGEWIKPGRTSAEQCELLKEAFNPLEIDMENQYVWWFVSGWMYYF